MPGKDGPVFSPGKDNNPHQTRFRNRTKAAAAKSPKWGGELESGSAPNEAEEKMHRSKGGWSPRSSLIFRSIRLGLLVLTLVTVVPTLLMHLIFRHESLPDIAMEDAIMRGFFADEDVAELATLASISTAMSADMSSSKLRSFGSNDQHSLSGSRSDGKEDPTTRIASGLGSTIRLSEFNLSASDASLSQYFVDMGYMFVVCADRQRSVEEGGGPRFFYAGSWSEAQMLCLRSPTCITVSWNRVTGRAFLCHGRFRRRRMEGLFFYWRSAMLGGCEVYDRRLASLNSQSHSPNSCGHLALHHFNIFKGALPCQTSLSNTHVGDDEGDEEGGGEGGWGGRRMRTKEITRVTDSVQSAAALCSVDPTCTSFTRHADSYRTVFCVTEEEQEEEEEEEGEGGPSLSKKRMLHPHIFVEAADVVIAEKSTNADRGGGAGGSLVGRSISSISTSISSLTKHLSGCKRGHSCLPPSATQQEQVGLVEVGPDFSSSSSSLDILSEFKLMRVHVMCDDEIVVGDTFTASVAEAAVFCMSQPHCTIFARDSVSKMTWFCQGYNEIIHSKSWIDQTGGFESFVSGIRRGCDHYMYREALHDVYTGKRPACTSPQRTSPTSAANPLAPAPAHSQSTTGAQVTSSPRDSRGDFSADAGEGVEDGRHPKCPFGLHAVPLNFQGIAPLAQKYSCEECPDFALCPEITSAASRFLPVGERMYDVPTFSAALDSLAKAALAEMLKTDPRTYYAAFNPVVFKHAGHTLVVVRITDAGRCSCENRKGEWVLDIDTNTYHSLIGLCELDPATLVPRSHTCTTLAPVPRAHIRGLGAQGFSTEDPQESFLGAEDPRPFSFQGTLYLICNMGIEYIGSRLPKGSASRWLRRLVLLTVTPGGKILSSTLLALHLNSDEQDLVLKDQKNLVPLVTESAVYIIYQVLPFIICKLDLDSGKCVEVQQKSRVGSAESAAMLRVSPGRDPLHIRGSTGFMRVPAGYLGIVHQVSEMELGRVYSHKWLLLSPFLPFSPKWMSAPFRLPLTSRLPAEDIQFAVGLVPIPGSHRAVLSYGVQDCLSWLATVDLPPQALDKAPDVSHSSPLRNKGDHHTSSSEPQLQYLRPVDPLRSRPSTARLNPHHPSAHNASVVVRWEAPCCNLAGFATVTRELARQSLRDPLIKMELHDTESQPVADRADPIMNDDVYSLIAVSNARTAPDLTVRLHWPVNFQPPAFGKWVAYLPWEFEVIPVDWVEIFKAHAAEVWVTAEYVRQGFLRSGLPGEMVAVVPHGVSTSACTALTPVENMRSTPIEIIEQFVFLFHGGLLYRKGVDILLKAYFEMFNGRDDVVLIVHSVYGDPELQDMVKEAVHKSDSTFLSTLPYIRRQRHSLTFYGYPKVKFLDKSLSPEELKALYAQASVLLHPSRSEGWGLALAEAAAQGLPSILPDYGAPLEILPKDAAFYFPATRSPCTRYPCSKDSKRVFHNDWVTQESLMWGDFTWKDLGHVMREVFETNPGAVKLVGKRAKRHICSNVTWEAAYSVMRDRILALAKS